MQARPGNTTTLFRGATKPIIKPTRDGNISVSIRKSAKRGHCTRAEQECCIMTD